MVGAGVEVGSRVGTFVAANDGRTDGFLLEGFAVGAAEGSGVGETVGKSVEFFPVGANEILGEPVGTPVVRLEGTKLGNLEGTTRILGVTVGVLVGNSELS